MGWLKDKIFGVRKKLEEESDGRFSDMNYVMDRIGGYAKELKKSISNLTDKDARKVATKIDDQFVALKNYLKLAANPALRRDVPGLARWRRDLDSLRANLETLGKQWAGLYPRIKKARADEGKDTHHAYHDLGVTTNQCVETLRRFTEILVVFIAMRKRRNLTKAQTIWDNLMEQANKLAVLFKLAEKKAQRS